MSALRELYAPSARERVDRIDAGHARAAEMLLALRVGESGWRTRAQQIATQMRAVARELDAIEGLPDEVARGADAPEVGDDPR